MYFCRFFLILFKPSRKSLKIDSTMKAWKADSELLLFTRAGTENLVGAGGEVPSSSLTFFNPSK
jgi:hypothetical protein